MVSLNTNVSAMVAQRHLSTAASQVAETQKNLSSGFRINSASDDAAGMQIANTLHVQTRGLDVALTNAHSAYAVAETAEGALEEGSEILQRLRSLSLQAANGSNSDEDRQSLQLEVVVLKDEVERIARTTTFAGKNLFDGSYGSKSFHLGANSNSISLQLKNMRTHVPEMGGYHYLASEPADEDWQVDKESRQLSFTFRDSEGDDQSIKISLKPGDSLEEVATYINSQQNVVESSVTDDRRLQFYVANRHAPDGLNISGSLEGVLDFEPQGQVTLDELDISSVGGAQLAIAVVDTAIQYLDSHRSEIGSFQNRVEGTMDNLQSINRNVTESKGRIWDTDFAKASTALVKSQVLQQATSALLAQAKQAPGSAIGLLS
ncbi:TPA: polar flagellin E [Vibrio vulnificus]|uniref:flagellin n=1 Tax=Vibrio vulnificus TaxID=672 RepID=UPI001A2034B0|nr:flagellin [Vibrio vulnificus]ELM6649583.1 flagellin [Vibrio vulnificus]MCG6285873.1 flagellin [Vibrio vulnificus]MCJ0823070.1 flagellin [Vibrio vulnificus]HAS6180757.1 polar flagellin E [Vibrio vulnificus]HAS6210210.1 polar flagellin E [Vibrio vulnificus]